MLDSDLAQMYGVETRVFNQAVKRIIERFPEEFRFLLTQEEYDRLRSQFATMESDAHLKSQSVTSSGHGGRRYLPYAFTEQGVAMLSAVLRSDTAVKVSIRIRQAFVSMRRFLSDNGPLLQRMETLEKRQIAHEIKTGEQVYRLGASLKDLGKKWFAFSRMEKDSLAVMARVKEVVE